MGLWNRLLGQPFSQREFAQAVITRLRKLRPTVPVQWDETEFALQIGSDRVLQLENLYKTYLQAPTRARKEVIATVSHVALKECDLPDTWEQARPRILPMLRELAFFWEQELVEPLSYFGESLGLALVLDFPEHKIYVDSAMLSRWNIKATDAVQAAHANLIHQSKGVSAEIHPGLFVFEFGDTYDATRILLPRLFDGLELKGEPVTLIPHRDVVLVTGSLDVENLGHLFNITRDGKMDVYPLSPVPLICRESRWHDFVPEHPAWRERIGRYRTQVYNEQSIYLNATYPGDVACAEALSLHREGTWLGSMTCWIEGENWLLPRCDWVMLGKTDGAKRIFALADVEQHFSAYFSDPAVVPRRLETLGFPTDTELDDCPSKTVEQLHQPS